MQNWLMWLDGFLHRHRKAVFILWAALIITAIPFAARQSENLSPGGFAVRGSESEQVADVLGRAFPNLPKSELGVLVVPDPGASESDMQAEIDRVERLATRTAKVKVGPRSTGRADASVGTPGPVLLPLALNADEDAAVRVASDLNQRLDAPGRPHVGVATYLIGEGAVADALSEVAKEDLSKAEERGFPIVLVILVIAFGSIGAATLPLAIGLFSLLLTGAAIFFISQQFGMSVYVTNMASMIGIGVAVDYSLFILARYREEIAAGREPATARSYALATSGLAVIFSGMTVIAAMAGLWLIDNQAIRSMAVGAILVVALSVIAAVTLLPVLIEMLGHRAYVRMRLHTVTGAVVRAQRWRRRRPGSTRPDRSSSFWAHWSMWVMRRPIVTLLVSGGVLVALALPALSLSMGQRGLDQIPRDNPARVGAELAGKLSGPGALTPMRIVVKPASGFVTSPSNRVLLARLRARVLSDPLVGRATAPLVSGDKRSALISATLRAEGESDLAEATLIRLRAALPAIAGSRAAVQIGGVTASMTDTQDLIAGSMWKIIAWILALALIVLIVILRSIALAIKAVLMNLLSVGAAYGILVMVFQWGWLEWLGFESLGQIGILTPPLVLAVVFGLSMDYEIFLLTRIRERFEATGDTREAVAQGLTSSARTITSAALIMVSVFAVFVFTGVPTIRELGLGCAVAIAIDATLVRLTLVPATMVLLGRWNWWLPKRLDRILPASFEDVPEPPASDAAPG